MRLPVRDTRLWLWGLLVAGLLLRIAISWVSIGTNDLFTLQRFAEDITAQGLFRSYGTTPLMNHPPLPMLWAWGGRWLASFDLFPYPFLFRLPVIAADIGSCFLILRIVRRREGPVRGLVAAVSYSWCLAALLVSGYHCNTDSIYAFFCLLAAYFVAERRAFFYAGLALGAAINIKLIPVCLIPALYALCRKRQEAVYLTLGLALCVLPFVPVLLFAGEGFLTQVVFYSPQMQAWGVLLLLMHLDGVIDGPGAMHAYAEYGRFFVLGACILLAVLGWRWRRWDAYQLMALTLMLFLIVTPGFGLQYVVAPLPLMFVSRLREATWFGAIAGVFLLLVYGATWTGTVPVRSLSAGWYPMYAAYMGLIAYGLLVVCFVRVVRNGQDALDVRRETR